MTRSRYRNWWIGFIAVASVALVLGLSQLGRSHTDLGLQQQVLSIASQLHAPGDFNTMTAATSSLTAAEHIRYVIQEDLLHGMSRDAIMRQMVQTYGPGVLAAPHAAGWGLVLWVAPACVLMMLGLGLWTVFRRTRIGAVDMAESSPDRQLPLEATTQAVAVRDKLKDYL